MNVMILVLSEGFSHSMKLKHLQKEVHYPAWGMYQSNSAYIRDTIDIFGLKQIVDTSISLRGPSKSREFIYSANIVANMCTVVGFGIVKYVQEN